VQKREHRTSEPKQILHANNFVHVASNLSLKEKEKEEKEKRPVLFV